MEKKMEEEEMYEGEEIWMEESGLNYEIRVSAVDSEGSEQDEE